MDDTDRILVRRGLQLLMPDPVPDVQERLDGGSGARVFAVDLRSGPAILKVTPEGAWRAAALRELTVHANPRLDPFHPRHLASSFDDDLVALLTERGDPLPATLSTAEWSRIAHRLGQLHRAGPTDSPVALPRGDSDTAATIWERAGAGAAARLAVERLDEARAISASAPTVLGHGDCHLGNVVLIRNEPHWIDWQQTHPGPGFDDLVFCWQRAEFAGVRTPRDAMSIAYAAGRGIAADQQLRSQLAAAELQLLLLAWPPHLGYGDATARQRMVDRMCALVEDQSWSRRACAA